MHPALTPDQEFFQATTRKFLDAESTPAQLRALAADPLGYRPGWWRQGAELGWTSPLVPEAAGGGSISGAGLADLALIAFEVGRHAAPGPLVPTNVAAWLLGRHPDAPAALHLPDLLSGATTAAWVRADLPASPLGGARVTAERVARRAGARTDADDGGNAGYVLDGHAPVVEGAADAELLVVTAGSDDGPIQAVIRRETDGVEVRRLEGLDLTRRWAAVALNGIRVGPDQLVGAGAAAAREGAGGAAADGAGSETAGGESGGGELEHQLCIALCLQQAESVGAMQAAFDLTLDWTFNRYSFGRPLASYQEIKHRVADMRMWLEASYAITAAAIDAFDAGRPDAAELAGAAKAYVGQFGPELVQDCVQIHGGIGVTFDHDLHLFLRRVTAAVPAYGSPAQHRRRLARMVSARVALRAEGVAS